MSLLRKFLALFRKEILDAEMTEEMRHHVELQTELNLKAGMNAEDARHAALRQFGNVAVVQEQARELRGWVWLEQLGQDLRYAVRQLARTPGFTIVAVLTLALGIGGTTAIFSMVNTVILNPVGGPEPERMVQIGQRSQILTRDRGHQETFQGVSPPVLEALLANRGQFANLGWSFPINLERKTPDFISADAGSGVSWDYFTALQCPPLLGRGFLEEEAAVWEEGRLNRNTAIVLSYGWWQSQWGGAAGMLGQVIEMGGRHFTVVGIMPVHFQFPDRHTLYWLPIERQVIRPGFFAAQNTKVFARLQAGDAATSAQALLDTLATRLMEAHPVTDGYGAMWRARQQSLRISLRPLSAALQDGGNWAQLRQTLWGLFAAISFVLLIVCANVANLALARLERRQHELAVRAALGAGRGRLMRQLLAENVTLALLGGAAGLIVTAWGIKALTALNVMPRLRPVEMDGPVLGVTLVLSAATALCFGLAPMWRGGNVRLQSSLADGGLNATDGKGANRYRNMLVVLQVAMTGVLLTGAGLMLLSVSRVLRVNPGFDPENLLLVETQLPRAKDGIPDRTEAEKVKRVLLAQIHARLDALPGVESVGVQQRSFMQSFEWPGSEKAFVAEHVTTGLGAASVFHALRIPLLAGRHFTEADVARPDAVIVNESMARHFWPNEPAVGKKFGGRGKSSTGFEVVGVVGDARLYGYLQEPLPSLYHPLGSPWTTVRLVGGAGLQFVIRTAGDAERFVPLIRHELKEAEPALLTPSIKVAKQVLYESTLAQRTYRNYLGLFALLGLALSSLGIYGVLAFSVSRRTREIGIRMAIGADDREVRAMVLKQGGKLLVAGLALGLVSAMGLMRLLQSLLFNVDPLDPIALTGATLLLAAVGLAACWLPARRASKVDPVIALRAE